MMIMKVKKLRVQIRDTVCEIELLEPGKSIAC